MSAPVASPTPGVEDDLDAVRAFQRKLYRAAKADPGRRFHALYDKVHRRDVLLRAWVQVWRNGGAPGIDQTTIADVEQYGVTRLLDELEAELQEGRFKPLPARRVYIPKPGQDELRPLSIPAIRDRVVKAAVKIVLDRSSRRTCCRVRLGSGPSARRTTPCRSSSTSPSGVGAGLSSRTSPTASRRSRTTG